METARDRPGNYRRFARLPMAFSLVEQEEGEDYYTVTLAFRPEGDFDGTPGQEQFFIPKEGTVSIRQVLSLPKGTGDRRFPILPVAIGLAGVVVAIIAVAVVFVAGGGGSAEDTPAEASGPAGTPSLPAAAPAPSPTSATALVSPLAAIPTPEPAATRTPPPTAIATLAVNPFTTPTRPPLLAPTQFSTPVFAPTPTRFSTPVPEPTPKIFSTPVVAPTPTPFPTPLPTPTPTLAPGGGRIVFHSSRNGSWEIYVMNADGSGQTRLTHDLASNQTGLLIMLWPRGMTLTTTP